MCDVTILLFFDNFFSFQKRFGVLVALGVEWRNGSNAMRFRSERGEAVIFWLETTAAVFNRRPHAIQ